MTEQRESWQVWFINHAHCIVPFGLGGGLGSFLAVATGAVIGADVGIAVYLSAVTTFLAAGLGLFSAWALAKRTDSIKCRRHANLARLRIRALRKEWQMLHDLLKAVREHNWTEPQIQRAFNIMKVATKTAEARPDFNDILDTEEDIKQAQIALDIFAFTARRFATPDDLRSTRSFVEKQFRGDFDAVMVGMQVDGLRAAETHFESKGS